MGGLGIDEHRIALSTLLAVIDDGMLVHAEFSGANHAAAFAERFGGSRRLALRGLFPRVKTLWM